MQDAWKQVLVNLLTNASKYSDRGGHIDLHVAEQDGQVVIRVRDNGIGIAPGLLDLIFEPFIQAERSLDRAEGGLGVGLTLAKRLIDMHGGTIEAHSEGLGRGSELIVRLPMLAAPATHPSNAGADEDPPPGAWRILVVDDNADAADSIALLLQAAGHDAEVAYSSEAALEAAVGSRPDVVLLDIGLPGMDGYEVARRLRAQPELENLRLIALTGYGHDSDRMRSREAGFDHHLVKPVEFDSLTRLLASLLPTHASESRGRAGGP
jgi:CheY-like chemotaxis protein